MSRIMGIDYGEVRIGIALSDPLKIISSGYKTLKNNEKIFDEILSICKLKEIESIVVGIPLNQNSEIGASAKKVLIFINNLIIFFNNNKFKMIFYEQDERYSTIEALEIMRKFKLKKKRKRKVIDQIAASKILSDFLESKNKKMLDLKNYSDYL